MDLPILKNFPIDCSSTNPEFTNFVNYLRSFTKDTLAKINSLDNITPDLIEAAGNIAQQILLTEVNDNSDLFNSDIYPEIFTGEYALETIEAITHLKEICELNWNLDTYPTLEIIDKGVRQEDAQNFFSFLKYIHTTLGNIKDALTPKPIE